MLDCAEKSRKTECMPREARHDVLVAKLDAAQWALHARGVPRSVGSLYQLSGGSYSSACGGWLL